MFCMNSILSKGPFVSLIFDAASHRALQRAMLSSRKRLWQAQQPAVENDLATTEHQLQRLLAAHFEGESSELQGVGIQESLRAAALLIAAGADHEAAREDAGAMGNNAIKAIFQAAAQGGRSHPLLQAAARKVDEVREFTELEA